jgi:hypothetical protein
MVHAFSATLSEFPDSLSVVGAVPLCLVMLGFCAIGAALSVALASIVRAKLCWRWVLAGVSAWLKAFVGFLFLYAIQIADKQNGDLGYAHFVLVGLVGIGLFLLELEDVQRNQRAPG